MYGCITQGKKLYVKDPRSQDTIITDSHQGFGTQKLQWAGKDKIFTTGWSDRSQREYKVYDVRNMGSALIEKKLDNEKLQMTNYLDYDTGVVYIINKGHSFTQFYHYNRVTNELVGMDKYSGEGI